MVFPPKLLDEIQKLSPEKWSGHAYRHIFGSGAIDAANTRGARWNPPDTAALYVSLTFDGAVAEGDHTIEVQPFPIRAKRTVYEVSLDLAAVIDISTPEVLLALGISADDLVDDDLEACQVVGGACAWTQADGILVPSARSDATNLVVFPTWKSADAKFEVIDSTVIAERSAG